MDFLKIKDLISEIKVEDFSSLSFDNYNEDRQQYWIKLLDFLKHEKNSPLSHYLIRDSDDIDRGDNTSSVFGRIDELADLNPQVFSDLISAIYGTKGNTIDLNQESGTTVANYFWNESVNYGIALWLSRIDPAHMILMESDSDTDMTSGRIKTNGAYFKIKDVKTADAGRNFNDQGSTISSNNWVRSWYNINKKNYSEVRGTDKINTVLNDGSKMDFTHNFGSNWIRLLMPEYGRTVEVEDLDRNFWVIAQVITAISAYLFDDDSPIAKAFKSLLEETVQLWENILYLWAALAIATREPFYTKLHSEYVVLSNNEVQPYVKFDNFDDSSVWPSSSQNSTTAVQNIWKRLHYLVDAYPDCNLCIIPEIRRGNYEHNLYNEVIIPGVFLFDRNEAYRNNSTGDEVETIVGGGIYNSVGSSIEHPVVKFIPFLGNNSTTITNNNYGIGNGTNSAIGQRVYCYTKNSKDEENIYRYFYPYSQVGVKKTLEPDSFYAGVRIIPAININYGRNGQTLYGYFYPNGSNPIFTIEIWDAVRPIITGSNYNVLTRGWNLSGEMTENTWGQTLSTATDILTIAETNFKKGIYFGELLSNFNTNPELNFDIDIQVAYFEPLGGPKYVLSNSATQEQWEDYNPQSNGGLYSKISENSEQMSSLKTANKNMLNLYINKKINSSDSTWKTHMDDPTAKEPLKIIVGARRCNLSMSTDTANYDLWSSFPLSTSNTNNNSIEAYKNAIGTKLGGYWTKFNQSNTITPINGTYQGHYYDPSYNYDHNPRVDFMNPLYADYFSNGYMIEGTDFSSMQDIKKMKDGHETYLIGHYTANTERFEQSEKVSNNYSTSNSAYKRYNNITDSRTDNRTDRYIYLQFGYGDYNSSSQTYDSRTIYRYCPYRYNTYAQTTFNVASIYAPSLLGNKIGNYSNYRHLYIGLPIYGENEKKDSIIDNLALGAFIPKDEDSAGDSSIGVYGRRIWSSEYTYIFKRRSTDTSLPKWFIMYIQQFSTRRALEDSFTGSYKSNETKNTDTRIAYLKNIRDAMYATSTSNIDIDSYTDGSHVKTIKKRGISGYSLAAPEKFDTTYVGGSDNSIIYHDTNYDTIKKYPASGLTIDRFWKDTNVSPMLARYFAIRKEMNEILDTVNQYKNSDWSLYRMEKEFNNRFSDNGTHFKALLRSAVIQTESRFNGNIYFAKKYTLNDYSDDDGHHYYVYKTSGNHNHKARWQSYKSKQTVSKYINEICKGPTKDTEMSNYAGFNSSNYSTYTILVDLIQYTVSELLCLEDDLNDGLAFYVWDGSTYNYKTDEVYGKVLANYWTRKYGDAIADNIPYWKKSSADGGYEEITNGYTLEQILRDIFENFYDHDKAHFHDNTTIDEYKDYRGHYVQEYDEQNNPKSVFKLKQSPYIKAVVTTSSDRIYQYEYNKFWWGCYAINDHTRGIDRQGRRYPSFISIESTGYSLSQVIADRSDIRFKNWIEKLRRLGPKGKPNNGESLILTGPMNLDTDSTSVGFYSTKLKTYNSKAFSYDKVKNIHFGLIGTGLNIGDLQPNSVVQWDTDNFTNCRLLSFSYKLFSEHPATAGDLILSESLKPTTTQTRITFFLPPDKNGKGTSYSEKFYLISDSYNLVHSDNPGSNWPQFATFTGGDKAASGETQAYAYSGESDSEFETFANYIENYTSSPSSSEYERIDTNKYYLDFFHYPITGGGIRENTTNHDISQTSYNSHHIPNVT